MAGRVLRKENEKKLRTAMQVIADILGELGDDASDEAKEAVKGLREAANLGDSLEARIHVQFVAAIDDLFGYGKLTRQERQDMLAALELALQSFSGSVQELAPQVYQRSPWADAPEPADLGESATLDGDFVPLVERAVQHDGTAEIRVIAPGWGSSGYYPAAVLERDGPRVFTRGVKSFWNHATPTEDAQRPEGDLNALAGELSEDARWEPNHPSGPGLYARMKVFKPYQEAVNDLASHIGVSIRATGRAAQGEAEGRKGPIIQALTAARSVDYVTEPGANGRIMEMFEAARPRIVAAEQQTTQEDAVADQKMQEAITRLEQQNARLQESLLLRDARDFAVRALAGEQLPDVTKARLTESLSANPPVKDGILDTATFAEGIKAAAQAEREYLANAAGYSGTVQGMGAVQPVQQKADDAQKRMAEAFKSIGLNDKAATIAVNGRG